MNFWETVAFWEFVINALIIYNYAIFIYVILTWFMPKDHIVMKIIGYPIEPALQAFGFAKINVGQGQYIDFAPIVTYLIVRYVLIKAAYEAAYLLIK